MSSVDAGQLKEHVRSILVSYRSVPDDFSWSAQLGPDLGLGSVEQLELFDRIQNATGVEFELDDFQSMPTPTDILDTLVRRAQ